MKIFTYIFMVIIMTITKGCSYEAGNVGAIATLTSNLKSDVIIAMTDSLHKNEYLLLPEKFDYLDEFYDYNHLNYKLYYFDSNPQEIYMVTYEGFESIRYVYSFETKKWLNRNTINKKEVRRVKERFISDVLIKIKDSAKAEGYKDEDLYLDMKNCGQKVFCE